MLHAVMDINHDQRRLVVTKLTSILGSLRGCTIGILGLAFKPNTDDMREAPSIALITALQDMGAKVQAYDPAGLEQSKSTLSDVAYCDGPYACAQDADALVIVTEWEQFRALDFNRLRDIMAAPVIVDLRNIYPPEEVTSRGFIYYSVGRPQTPPAKSVAPAPVLEVVPAPKRHQA